MGLTEIVKEYGLDDKEQLVFKEYISNRFQDANEIDTPDTSFLEFWDKIIIYAGAFGVDRAINDKICPDRPVRFLAPEGLEIDIYQSIAGRIPIISVPDAEDFELLVTNIAYNGIRPDNISSTGASFISGKTTRFIILSQKPYSNVPAAELGLTDEEDYKKKSFFLRRGHECTHYFTRQTYGKTNNILHDEVMADFIGMYEAFGFYKAEWFLRFMGIIEGSGKRLSFYTKELPVRVQKAVSRIAVLSSNALERWSLTDSFKAMSEGERIKYMCKCGLEKMALMS